MKLTEKANASLNKVIEKMKTGDLSPVIEIAMIKLPDGSDFPAARWTSSNRLLAYLQTGDIDCRGIKQWREVGRHLIKGCHAGFILIPCFKKDEDKDEDVLVGFRTAPVYGIQSTEGETIDGLTLEPKNPPPLIDVAKRFNVDVSYIPDVSSWRGQYNATHKKITLCTHHEKTFFHELAHAAHDRIETNLKHGQDPKQETIAEFTACVLAFMYGKDYTGNSWEYIQSYNKEPIKAIMSAMDTIQKVINEITEEQ